MDDLVIRSPMPPAVNSVNAVPTVGTASYDQVNKELVWKIRKFPTDRAPVSLKGSVGCGFVLSTRMMVDSRGSVADPVLSGCLCDSSFY